MKENIPPIPPAQRAPEPAGPYHPHQSLPLVPEGYDQPAYPVQAQPRYAMPPGRQYQELGNAVPGSYPQPGTSSHTPPQYAPPPQWTPAGQQKPRTSGFRISSGIVGIMLGTWLFIPAIAGFGKGGAGFLSFLILVAALGNLTAGIVLLANQRGRKPGPPITSLSFAGFSLLLGVIALAVPYFGAVLLVTAFPLAAPVLIVMGIGLSRERHGA